MIDGTNTKSSEGKRINSSTINTTVLTRVLLPAYLLLDSVLYTYQHCAHKLSEVGKNVIITHIS